MFLIFLLITYSCLFLNMTNSHKPVIAFYFSLFILRHPFVSMRQLSKNFAGPEMDDHLFRLNVCFVKFFKEKNLKFDIIFV